MDTTTPSNPNATCFRCSEQYVADTLYIVYIALMQAHPSGAQRFTERMAEAPANIMSLCGDCTNLAMGMRLTPSVRSAEEAPGTIRLRIKTDAPVDLIPEGYQAGDTVGFPTGGSL